ncbi:dentin sialophosphoprotein-like [Mytilus californianus]|uniref:dentin sialophosphoprotein-like n=1 Tax=Mytilus californianus TaxID=6549 RepID=UPI0022459C9B|nr:dentin sialophosphoprotein-like [Mytilus californianus]XP_052067577.1 dentin sialophosphoprotein-like [Mytilus californianus]
MEETSDTETDTSSIKTETSDTKNDASDIKTEVSDFKTEVSDTKIEAKDIRTESCDQGDVNKAVDDDIEQLTSEHNDGEYDEINENNTDTDIDELNSYSQLGQDLPQNVIEGQKPKLSESSSDGMISNSPSVEMRSRLTSAEDTDSTIKPGNQKDSDSSDSKSIETLDYTSSEDKSIETIDSEDDRQIGGNSDVQNRPESLILNKTVNHEKRRSRSDDHKKIDTTRTMSSSTAVDIPLRRDSEFENIEETMLSKSMPHGTVTRKGDMIEFVADDLQEMIKRSSPLTQTASSETSSRRSSLRSYSSVSSSTSSAIGTASGVSRSPSSLFQQSPDDIPPIDPQAVHDLEMHALKVADNLDLLMGNLKTNLHKMSAITVGCLSAYKTSVDTTCDSVDGSIKSMYALMAKCEELSNSMKPVNKLAEQIKEIKRLLDRFETQIADKP